MSGSPFLHQGEGQRRPSLLRQDARQQRDEEDRDRARVTLESLRYRWWVRRGTLGSFMQSLGNYGRKHLGFMDPRQTGGGWW